MDALKRSQTQVGHRRHSNVLKIAAALFAFATLCGLQAATQYTAAVFDYSPLLGLHAGYFYPPISVLWWAYQWHAPMAHVFTMAAEVGVGVWGAVITAVVYLWPKRKVTDTLHGSARWASHREVREAGLLQPPTGHTMVVGGYRDRLGRRRYLRHSGFENVLVYGPPRSGKGAGLVVPTLLEWEGSTIVTDLRGELYQLTAGHRRLQHQRILRFAPAELDSVAWNPLEEIRVRTEFEVADVQRMAEELVSAESPKSTGDDNPNSFFAKAAQALLEGLILYVIHEDEHPATIARILELVSVDKLEDLWKRMSASTHPTISGAGNRLAQSADKTASDIVNNLMQVLRPWRDPLLARNTRRCDFRIRDLNQAAKAHTLYLVTKPGDLNRLRPIMRLFITQTMQLLAGGEMNIENAQAKASYKHRLLLMVDEFPSLGRLDALANGLAYLGGSGITSYLICQDSVQFKDVYGAAEGKITAACHVQVAFPPNRTETAKMVSELLGKTTVSYQSPSKGTRGKEYASETTHWAGRELLTADEVRSLPGPKKRGDKIVRPGHMLTIIAGRPPIYGLQPLYFQDRKLKARALTPANAQPRFKYVAPAMRMTTA